jgi:hypothetical protein
MANENIKIKGHIAWELIRDGVVVESGERDNIITTAGKNALASLLNSASAGTSLITHMGFGTSTTAVAVGDTALGTELSAGGYSRVAVSRSVANNVITYTATLTGVTSNPTIQEAGLFNASTAGTLFAHQLTGAVNLATSSDSLAVTWTVTFS